MKPVMIDFADRRSPWRWDWRLPAVRLGVLMLVLAAVLGAAAAQRSLRLGGELARARAGHAALLQQHERAASANRERMRLGAQDAQLLRQSELQRALPWEAIFRAFEQAPQARLVALEPDVARGVVKVQARIADIAALQGYLAALQESPVFVRVSLLHHEAAPEGGIGFNYEAVLASPYRLPEPDQREAQ